MDKKNKLDIKNVRPKEIDLTKGIDPKDNEIIVIKTIYDNGDPVVIKEIKSLPEEYQKPTIQEKVEIIQTEKISLQYKLITGQATQEEINILKLL